MALDDDRILGTQEVADLLGMNVQMVRKYAREGRLPAHRLPGGRTFKFYRTEILGYVRRFPIGERSPEEGGKVVPGDDRILGAQEVADLLGMNVQMVRKYAREGRFPAYRLPGGRAFKFFRGELQDYANDLPTRTAGAGGAERPTGTGSPGPTPATVDHRSSGSAGPDPDDVGEPADDVSSRRTDPRSGRLARWFRRS